MTEIDWDIDPPQCLLAIFGNVIDGFISLFIGDREFFPDLNPSVMEGTLVLSFVAFGFDLHQGSGDHPIMPEVLGSKGFV